MEIGVPRKSLVLLKLSEGNNVEKKLESSMAEKPLLYSKVIAFSNLMDRAMFYKVNLIYCSNLLGLKIISHFKQRMKRQEMNLRFSLKDQVLDFLISKH